VLHLSELGGQVIARQQPIPGFKPEFLLGTALKDILARPGLGGRMPLQILMWPDVVVPEPE